MTIPKFQEKSFSKLSKPINITLSFRNISRVRVKGRQHYKYNMWLYIGNTKMSRVEVWDNTVEDVKQDLIRDLKHVLKYFSGG